MVHLAESRRASLWHDFLRRAMKASLGILDFTCRIESFAIATDRQRSILVRLSLLADEFGISGRITGGVGAWLERNTRASRLRCTLRADAGIQERVESVVRRRFQQFPL